MALAKEMVTVRAMVRGMARVRATTGVEGA
jgi:hypothetical protein